MGSGLSQGSVGVLPRGANTTNHKDQESCDPVIGVTQCGHVQREMESLCSWWFLEAQSQAGQEAVGNPRASHLVKFGVRGFGDTQGLGS